MSDFERPKYVPLKFYNDICAQIKFLNKHIINLRRNEDVASFNKYNIIICEEQKNYCVNFIENSLNFKDFYLESQGNEDLLLHVRCAFKHLPEWRYDFKTSGREDALAAEKMRKALEKCTGALSESVDLRFNVQMFWEKQIIKLISSGSEERITDGGRETLKLAKQMIFPNFSNQKNLVHKGMIKEGNTTSNSVHHDLMHLFLQISEYLAEIKPLAAGKSMKVKKINSKDAYLHYIVRTLKEIFEVHGVNNRKHVRYINDLVMGILGEDVDLSEERIRKLIQ